MGAEEELRGLISPILEAEGLDLVEFNFSRSRGAALLRLLVDRKEGGITVEECAGLNRRIGALLDGQDFIRDRYILEVSSPGLDRPLKERNDFLRCLNRKIWILLKEPLKGNSEIRGAVKAVKEENLEIDCEGLLSKIPISGIIKAKQIL